jgi:F-type H+-transporting ATPase subunit beta
MQNLAENNPQINSFRIPKSETLTNVGAIISVRGSVVDVHFEDYLPPINSLLHAGKEGRIVLSRDRASEGLFPAIDALQSSSKMATPGIAGERHYNLAQEIRRTLAQYEELKDIIAMLGLEQRNCGGDRLWLRPGIGGAIQ